ncbi:MAG TPA: GNAT family N-acetyltransferase [Streptosporangiaceae bacterium]|nr:GNAT family N-acetyltransferase [Streptosporangiaceae bacterium]
MTAIASARSGLDRLVEPDALGYQVVLARSAAEVDAAQWDAVALAAGGSIFHSHAWHSCFDEAAPGLMTPAHLLAYRDGKLAGICPAYLIDDCPRLRYAFSLDRPAALAVDGPVLLAHSLAALKGGPLASPGHPGALRALDAGLRRAARELGAWCHGYANLSPGPFSGWLLGQGYATAEVAISYEVSVRWDSADEYWAAMRSRRRQSLRNARSRTLGAGWQISGGPPEQDEAIGLIHKLLVGYGTPTDLLPRAFLVAVLRNLAGRERSVTARDPAGRARAVFTGWRFGDHQAMWLAGLDSEELDAFEPYHAMLAEVIETAIAEHVQTIDLGRANPDIKRRYGARPVPLLLSLRSGRPDRDALLHLWCKDLQRRNRAVLNGLETASRCC